MIKSGIFNSVNGDRRYKSEDFAAYFATFIANGVFPNPSTGLQVIADSNMNVFLKAGQAWINGYYITNTDNYFMKLDVADGVLNRIDRIVLQLNYLNRNINPIVKKGAFSSSPVAPTLNRNADVYEIALADIYVGKGVLSVSQANITDLRLNKDLCGIVHGVIDQVDTTTIFNQYKSWFEQAKQKADTDIVQWTNQKQQEFMDWFNDLNDTLTENAETNILKKINDLKQNVETHSVDSSKHVSSQERERWNDIFSTYKSQKNIQATFEIIEKKRPDGTLFAKSFLRTFVDGKYKERVYTEYGADGRTVIQTVIFDLIYDTDGDLKNEVKRP